MNFFFLIYHNVKDRYAVLFYCRKWFLKDAVWKLLKEFCLVQNQMVRTLDIEGLLNLWNAWIWKKTILEIPNIVKLVNSISLHVIFKYYFVNYKFKFMIAIFILLLHPYISKFVSYQLSFLFEEGKHFFMVVCYRT